MGMSNLKYGNDYNEEYFNRQFVNPYRSTVKFCDWLEQLHVLNNGSKLNIMDFGTGKGANLFYMSERFPNCTFTGIDINKNLIQDGKTFFIENKIKNCNLEYGDVFNLDFEKYNNLFNGIISYQTLSWLPEYETVLKEIIKLNPKWISLTSLFYNGLVDCKIEVKEYQNPINNEFKSLFYNVYSLPIIEQFFSDNGYNIFKYHPFEIDIDLPKPDHTSLQTYTEKLIDGRRIQISGPLLMSWYFIYAEKKI